METILVTILAIISLMVALVAAVIEGKNGGPPFYTVLWLLIFSGLCFEGAREFYNDCCPDVRIVKIIKVIRADTAFAAIRGTDTLVRSSFKSDTPRVMIINNKPITWMPPK